MALTSAGKNPGGLGNTGQAGGWRARLAAAEMRRALFDKVLDTLSKILAGEAPPAFPHSQAGLLVPTIVKSRGRPGVS